MRLVFVLLAWGCASTDDTDDGDDTDTSPEDTDTDGGTDTDTDPLQPVAVTWRQVGAGYHPDSAEPVTGSPCNDIVGDLLHTQEELTEWGAQYGGGATLEYTVDWVTEAAVGGWVGCSTTNHLVVIDRVEGLGTELTVYGSVDDLEPIEDVETTAWAALAVDGLEWTAVTWITEPSG